MKKSNSLFTLCVLSIASIFVFSQANAGQTDPGTQESGISFSESHDREIANKSYDRGHEHGHEKGYSKGFTDGRLLGIGEALKSAD